MIDFEHLNCSGCALLHDVTSWFHYLSWHYKATRFHSNLNASYAIACPSRVGGLTCAQAVNGPQQL